jgi:hypothetical protein
LLDIITTLYHRGDFFRIFKARQQEQRKEAEVINIRISNLNFIRSCTASTEPGFTLGARARS